MIQQYSFSVSRESIPSAFDINDSKLVLFFTKEREGALKKSLDQQLMSVNSHFYALYRIQTHTLALEVQGQCQDGKCTPGTQMVFENRNNETLLGTIGAFLTDDRGNDYMLSSCHGFRVQHVYINVANEEGVNRRIPVGSCVADVNQKAPLLDACLIQVENEELRAMCHPLIPGLTQKVFVGPYTGPIGDLAQLRTAEDANDFPKHTDVMKYGATTELTYGKLVYYDFSLPSAKISGALVTSADKIRGSRPFIASGDSGAVIFRSKGELINVQIHMVLHEALSVHCVGLLHLDDEKEVSLSFRLDEVMTYLGDKINRKLNLLGYERFRDF